MTETEAPELDITSLEPDAVVTPAVDAPASDAEVAAEPVSPENTDESLDSIEAAWDAHVAESTTAGDHEDGDGPERDEKGRFKGAGDSPKTATAGDEQTASSDESDAKGETPAPRTLTIKVDKDVEIIDVDKEMSTESGREALAEYVRKGKAFDTVVPRRESAARVDGIRHFAKLIREAGYDLEHIPATELREEGVAVKPRGGATPTSRQPAQSDTTASPPTEPPRLDELVHAVFESDDEATARAALMQAMKVVSQEAAAQAVKPYQERLQQREQEKAAERQRQEQEQNNQRFKEHVDETITGNLSQFPESRHDALRARAWQIALASAYRPGVNIGDVDREVAGFFEDLRPFLPQATSNGSSNGATPRANPGAGLPPPIGSGASFSGGGGEDAFAAITSLDDDDDAWRGLRFSQ